MMKELGAFLKMRGESRHPEDIECVGSVLWSDIGPKFYGDLGWKASPATHVQLPALSGTADSPSITTKPLLAKDIGDLCANDEVLLLESIGDSSSVKTLFAIAPNHSTMLWHHKKEEYICEKIFGRQPTVKGALAGEPGNRIWAIWTRGIYGALDDPEAGNRLYILRLVIEDPDLGDLGEQAEQLKAVLHAAQMEAAEWKLGHVEMWNPDERTKELIERTKNDYRFVERESEGIPSLMWFSEGNAADVEWKAAEKFSWC